MGLTCTDTLSTAYLKANMHQKGFFFLGGGQGRCLGVFVGCSFWGGGFPNYPYRKLLTFFGKET